MSALVTVEHVKAHARVRDGEKLCAQCWQPRPIADFMGARGGEVTWCVGCRDKYKGGKGYDERASIARRGLRTRASEPCITWAARSGNRKLGGIPAAIISAETCPPACSFFGRGCYAEFGVSGHHWRRAQKTGIVWAEFIEHVVALPPNQLWRYAVAGDLPGNGNELDRERLLELVEANVGRRGFTYTHKPLRKASERKAIERANGHGFTVNLSADSLRDADQKASLSIAPVTVVLPSDAPDKLRTPAGRHVIVCPAETGAGLDCARCGLCAIAGRKVIIGFRAHGQMKATVSRIVRAVS